MAESWHVRSIQRQLCALWILSSSIVCSLPGVFFLEMTSAVSQPLGSSNERKVRGVTDAGTFSLVMMVNGFFPDAVDDDGVPFSFPSFCIPTPVLHFQNAVRIHACPAMIILVNDVFYDLFLKIFCCAEIRKIGTITNHERGVRGLQIRRNTIGKQVYLSCVTIATILFSILISLSLSSITRTNLKRPSAMRMISYLLTPPVLKWQIWVSFGRTLIFEKLNTVRHFRRARFSLLTSVC
jgi:hypothetical protein